MMLEIQIFHPRNKLHFKIYKKKKKKKKGILNFNDIL